MRKKLIILFVIVMFLVGVQNCLKSIDIDNIKELPNLICGKTAVGGNYNSTRDNEEENNETQMEDEEEKILFICETVRAMDFTVNEPNLDITPQENLIYLEGYLKVLKNEIPIASQTGEVLYYKDLWKAGFEFEELLKEKETRKFPFLYYYDDLDGDGKPELVINQGCMFLLKYEADSEICRILYQEDSCYFKKIIGTGQIWRHDGIHANIMRDSLILLNDEGSFEEVLSLEEGLIPECPYFDIGILNKHYMDVGEENWNEITAPFFEMVENNGLPEKTLEEIFGELLEKDIKE